MLIRELIRKGSDHPAYCEDFHFSLILPEVEEIVFCGVFDGCSTGVKSHFASSLLGKIIRKSFMSYVDFIKIQLGRENKPRETIVQELMYRDAIEFILYQTLVTLDSIKSQLDLNVLELLSTIVLVIYNKETTDAIYCVVGDGAIFWKNEEGILQTLQFESENNAPQYISYLLPGEHNSFQSIQKNWPLNKDSIVKVGKFKSNDLSISTDGIFTFRNKDNKGYEHIIDYFLNDEFLSGSEAMLARKYKIISTNEGYSHADDLGIIRIINK